MPVGFQQINIERFLPNDVNSFFQQWYKRDQSLTPDEQSRIAQALFEAVRTTPGILHLAQNPLLCTVPAILWQHEGESLPTRRTALYERCCRIFLEDWEPHRNITLPDTVSEDVSQRLSKHAPNGSDWLSAYVGRPKLPDILSTFMQTLQYQGITGNLHWSV